MFIAYVLKSIKDGKYYYGSTANVDLRLKKHNAGGVPSTKYRRPFQLHYQEQYENKLQAMKR